MYSEKYIYITKSRVVPATENDFPNGDGIFQHDLSSCHTLRRVKKVAEGLKINMLRWRGDSPDYNPIGNLMGHSEV
jgi:hypothetical protein